MIKEKIVEDVFNIIKDKKVVIKKCLDIKELSVIADYFFIISVDSDRAVNAISDMIEDKMDARGYILRTKEGINTKWVILDYNDIIIHIFEEEERKYYNLERIWADATEIDDII